MKFVEATLVMPLTCMILISLISLMMIFYNELLTQTETNAEELAGIYENREVTYIRTYDRLENGFAQ